VAVPHTWNTTKETAKYYGLAWYEKEVFIPVNWKDRNSFLQFDAVFHDATIYINGNNAGGHLSSGYTKFFIKASKYLIPGKQNIITVKVDNSFSANNIPYANIFDWANDGGIIRSVKLVSTLKPKIDFIHVLAKPDFSSPAKGGKGTANFKIKLAELAGTNLNKVSFQVTIKETNQPTNRVIYSKKLIPIFKNEEASFDIEFDNINRWHFDYPNLYTINLTVLYRNKSTDADTTNFGFREFKTNGDKFVFNRETIRTAGVEWMGGSSLLHGMAENKDEMKQSLEKLQYLNTMFTRFHLQQDDYVYDWCDKNGIMIQQEIPIWGHKTHLTDTILRIAKSQLNETIGNAYNHPSIIAWGVGNEIEGRDDKNIEGVKALYHYVKGVDSSRLVNYVSNTLQISRSWVPNIVKDATSYGDVMMYNDYHSSWYRQAKAGIGALLDTIQVENRTMPLVISEFGLCEPENWGDDAKRIADMIYNYAVYESKPYIAGVIYFCLNDYRTHMGSGKYGFHSTRVHGVFDLEGNPKPSAAILKEMNCPLTVTGINRNRENDMIFTVAGGLGFPSYVLNGFKFYWSPKADNFKNDGVSYELPSVKPGETYDFSLPNKFNDKGVVTILGPKGNIVYQREVTNTSPYF
jgi:beta-glucuronidase